MSAYPDWITLAKPADLRSRADVDYWLLEPVIASLYSKPSSPLVPLGDIASLVQYGSSKRATLEEVGTPILRMSNLQDDTWDLTELKYVDLTPSELETYRLAEGDILFTRTNGSKHLVGKCAVFNESGTWVFASYLIRVRVDPDRALPAFVAAFLNTTAGRLQVERLSRQIMMSNINAEEIRAIELPLPSLAAQRRLLTPLMKMFEVRSAAREKAEDLLSSSAVGAQSELGIKFLPGASVGAFAILRTDWKGRRLDPGYYHPDRVNAARSIEASDSPAVELRQVVEIIAERPAAPEEISDYIGLASVQQRTGELIEPESDEDVQSAQFFKAGDILYARLRPNLNKVWVADRDGLCSTEFRVLRPLAGVGIRADYLGLALRMPTSIAQASHAASGNTHPRLADEDLLSLVIPLPSLKRQSEVVRSVLKVQQSAFRVRGKADEAWLAAKTNFQNKLLGV